MQSNLKCSLEKQRNLGWRAWLTIRCFSFKANRSWPWPNTFTNKHTHTHSPSFKCQMLKYKDYKAIHVRHNCYPFRSLHHHLPFWIDFECALQINKLNWIELQCPDMVKHWQNSDLCENIWFVGKTSPWRSTPNSNPKEGVVQIEQKCKNEILCIHKNWQTIHHILKKELCYLRPSCQFQYWAPQWVMHPVCLTDVTCYYEMFIISNPQKARTSKEELSLWQPSFTFTDDSCH